MIRIKSGTREKIISVRNNIIEYFRGNSGWFYFMIAVITLFRLVIGADRLIQELYLPHDDLLYLQLAHHIVNGEWLGPLDPLTLAKSCIFPVFIALGILSGLPYLVFLDLLICGTAFLGQQALRPCINRFWSLVIYTVLLFNPAYFFYQRLVIQDLYATLITGMIACLAACWLRRDRAFIKTVPWIIGGSLFFAIAVHSREEGKILIVIFAGLFLLLLLDVWIRRVPCKEVLRAAVVWIAIPAVCYLGLNITIRQINRHYYGIAETCIRNNRSYKGFIGTLLGAAKCIDPEWDIRIPLRYEIFDQLCEMSPTLKMLKPYMNRKTGWHMITNERFPANVLEASPNLKINTKGGFIQWEILDAMLKAKLYAEGNTRKAEQFYQKVVEELSGAAGQGKIPGFKVRYSNLVPLSSQMIIWFLRKFFWDAENIFTWGNKFIAFHIMPRKTNRTGMVRFYYSSLKNANFSAENYFELIGWGKIPSDKTLVRSHNFDRSKVIEFAPMPRPDVQNFLAKQSGYPNIPRQSGFIMLLSGDTLQVFDNQEKIVYQGKSNPGANPYIHIDNITKMKGLSSTVWKRQFLKKICLFYRNRGVYFSLSALLLGFAGLIYGIFRRKAVRPVIDLLVSGLMFWFTGLMYFCLIVFANVMLHCSRQPGYYMPAFAQIFTACAIVAIGIISVLCSGSSVDCNSETFPQKDNEK